MRSPTGGTSRGSGTSTSSRSSTGSRRSSRPATARPSLPCGSSTAGSTRRASSSSRSSQQRSTAGSSSRPQGASSSCCRRTRRCSGCSASSRSAVLPSGTGSARHDWLAVGEPPGSPRPPPHSSRAGSRRVTTLRVGHLYPDYLNIYADRGNIAVLARRAAWRGHDLAVTEIGMDDVVVPGAHDLYYVGGGQDREQLLVA